MELLEQRQLLSGAYSAVQPDTIFLRDAASSSADIQGYAPSQIAQAYGYNGITLSNGAKGDGAGQTIAIVDAYNDPNIASDLGVFDSEFGLPAPPSFKVVNQNGGSSLPSSSGSDAAGWAGEISLDVEWAHALAPDANILLVEANSDQTNQNTGAPNDLLAGVKYAASVPGVSVISMSWGGSEFYSYTAGGEFQDEANFDSDFTTPSGHQGITFVAAAGDSGAQSGVQWPAVSPNVLSVGGTSLYTSDSGGTYYYEAAWSGTSGGTSQLENEPSYQDDAQATGVRTAPDVAFDGDPNTGLAVYDSVSDQGYVGWQEVGGTSAGSPSWAALIAIANQGRASAGEGTLDGASQALPLLYSLYGDTGTTGVDATSYTNAFNDVTQNPGGGPVRYRFGGYGYGFNSATPGYDLATGLGSPKAVALVDGLTGTTTPTPTPTPTQTPTPTPTPTQTPTPTSTADLPPSPVSAVFSKFPAASAIGGEAASVKLTLTNISGSNFSGPLQIDIFASTTSAITSGDTDVASMTLPDLNLGAVASNHSKTVKLRFVWPSSMTNGTYYLVADVNATATDTDPSQPATPAVSYAEPTVDLSTTFGNTTSVGVNPGKNGVAIVTVENLGNVLASGTLSLTLYASSSPNLDASVDQQLAIVESSKIAIKPGHSKQYRVHFTAPADAAGGTYYLIASTIPSTSIPDTNSANDVAVISTIAE